MSIAPPELQKRGIRRAESNLQADQEIRLPAGALMTWLGDELIEELRRRQSAKVAGVKPRRYLRGPGSEL